MGNADSSLPVKDPVMPIIVVKGGLGCPNWLIISYLRICYPVAVDIIRCDQMHHEDKLLYFFNLYKSISEKFS